MIDPDAPLSLFTRFWDWLTYKPWTDDEIAEQVARSVANTSYRTNWGRPITGEQTVGPARWMGGYWTDEEAAMLDAVKPARIIHIKRSDYYKDFSESIHRPLTEADYAELDPINVLTADWTDDVCHLTGDDGFCAECGRVVEEDSP